MDRNGSKAVLYQNLAIEPTVPRDGSGKQLFTYDKSLSRLQKAGYQRHLRPAEAFSLLAGSLESTLNGLTRTVAEVQRKQLENEVTLVAEDMLSSYGEWLSLAMERKGDTLFCHFDPQGLEWNGSTYVKTADWKSTEQREFSIAGKPSQKWIDLKEFDDNLVVALYGRSWKDLPQKMKTGDRRAQMYLPPEGVLWPVARGNFYYSNFVVSCYSYLWASRGGSPRR